MSLSGMSLIWRFTQTDPNAPPGGATHVSCSCFHSCVPCTSSVVTDSFLIFEKTKICKRTPWLLVSDCVRTHPVSKYCFPGSGTILWHASSKFRFRCPLKRIRSDCSPECFSERSYAICTSFVSGKKCQPNPPPSYPDSSPPSHKSEPSGSGGGGFCIIDAACDHARAASAIRV